jgi:hypothetical protein
LPEGLCAFLPGDLGIQADVAQKVLVKLGQTLAVALTAESIDQRSRKARDKACAGTQGKGLDLSMGHLRLLRFVLIQ